MSALAWTALAFVVGAIPFSVLIGYLVAGVDIRSYGDGNPGATNVKRATGSLAWFLLAVFLDISKGLVPVALAFWYGDIAGWEIAAVALAAVLGHAFSPFLRFNGGKAIATSGGIWMALTYFASGFVQVFLLVYIFYSIDSSDWTIILTGLGFGLYLFLTGAELPYIALWVANMFLFAAKHRHGLHRRPGLKRWLPFLPAQSA